MEGWGGGRADYEDEETQRAYTAFKRRCEELAANPLKLALKLEQMALLELAGIAHSAGSLSIHKDLPVLRSALEIVRLLRVPS